MQRFRLLGFYVVGVVAVVGLAVWGVSMRRTAADAGTPQVSEGGTVAPSTANTEPSSVTAGLPWSWPSASDLRASTEYFSKVRE
jgi:hypothetical protein